MCLTFNPAGYLKHIPFSINRINSCHENDNGYKNIAPDIATRCFFSLGGSPFR